MSSILLKKKHFLSFVAAVAISLSFASLSCLAGGRLKGVDEPGSVECSSVVLGDGVRVNGVLCKKRKLDGNYFLRLSRRDGLVFFDSSGKRLKSLSSKQVAEAAEHLIVKIQSQGGSVAELQLDLDLVGDLWGDIRNASRTAVLNGTGPLYPKDKALAVAVNRAIKGSNLLRRVCEVALRQGMRCDTQGGYLEAVVFKEEQSLSSRKHVAQEPDVGIRADYGFAVSFVRSKKR